MFKKHNWLSNSFMLLASIFFIVVIITAVQKTISDHNSKQDLRVEQEPLTFQAVQVYKNDAYLKSISLDQSDVKMYQFRIVGVQDSIVYFQSEKKEVPHVFPPCRFEMVGSDGNGNMMLPVTMYDKPLLLQYVMNDKLVSTFPPFVLNKIAAEHSGAETDNRGNIFYKIRSVDGMMMVYMILN